MHEGTSDNHLYVVVRAPRRRQERRDRQPLTVSTLAAGDLVGELGFIDGTSHYASLVAIGPTRVLGLEREKLESLLRAHPEVVYHVMRAIVRTVHRSSGGCRCRRSSSPTTSTSSTAEY